MALQFQSFVRFQIHPKSQSGKSLALNEQGTGSVDRADFSQMTGTRSGYLERDHRHLSSEILRSIAITLKIF